MCVFVIINTVLSHFYMFLACGEGKRREGRERESLEKRRDKKKGRHTHKEKKENEWKRRSEGIFFATSFGGNGNLFFSALCLCVWVSVVDEEV